MHCLHNHFLGIRNIHWEPLVLGLGQYWDEKLDLARKEAIEEARAMKNPDLPWHLRQSQLLSDSSDRLSQASYWRYIIGTNTVYCSRQLIANTVLDYFKSQAIKD